MNLPISFQNLARGAGNAAKGGYPYQLSGKDLDKNFVFSALDADPSLIEQTTAQGGHKGRKLKIPAVPSGDSPQQLTASRGTLSWSSGIPAGTASGELLRWNSGDGVWEPFGRGTNTGQFIMWGNDGWQAGPNPPESGTHVLGVVNGSIQWIATEAC